MEKVWKAPTLEELSIPDGTEGGVVHGLNDDNGADDGTLS